MTVAAKMVLSTGLISSLITSAVAADMPRKAPVKPAMIADRCAKVEPPKGTPEVPGGDIFGFSDATDIGDPCSWSLSNELTGFAGKRDGRYLALTNKTEIGYTYSDKAAFSVAMFNTYHRWSNVTVAQDALAGAALSR